MENHLSREAAIMRPSKSVQDMEEPKVIREDVLCDMLPK